MQYLLTGIPATVIDGCSIVEPALAGSLDGIPMIPDYLVRKVRQDRQLALP